MTAATPPGRPSARRRVPIQQRSRERVERILDAASTLIVEDGVEALSTRAVADQAGVPVASLYQYFADRDEILLSLVQRDVGEMDAQVSADVASLQTLTVRGIVEATMRAFVSVYHRRPAFVVVWWRGRTSVAVREFCRDHNRRVAQDLFEVAAAAGVLRPGTDPLVAELAVEVGDRVFQVAFERELDGDPRIVDEGIELVVGYLERYATPAGLGAPA